MDNIMTEAKTTYLAKTDQQPSNSYGNWTEEDKKLIKDTVAKGANESEFKLFLYTAAKYELDPLVKQIWCIKYGDKPAAIFIGRDGFLAIAHRSGQFNGMETTSTRNDKGQLLAARCVVWRKDMTHPFTVDVPLSEYNTNQSNWSKMPETMLKKVAESQCLRRAFNISGLYSPEEMPEEIAQPSNWLEAPLPLQEVIGQAKPAQAPKPSQAPKPPQTALEQISTQKNYFTYYADKLRAAKTIAELVGIKDDSKRDITNLAYLEDIKDLFQTRQAELGGGKVKQEVG